MTKTNNRKDMYALDINPDRPVCYKIHHPDPPGQRTRVQSDIRQFFGLLNSSVANEDAVCKSDRPYQSESADIGQGLACLVLPQSQLNMTAITILNEFASEARRLKD